MDTLVIDPRMSDRLIEERRLRGADRFDEVWEGTYVMSPAPNDEHQQLTTRLSRALLEVVEDAGIGEVRIGINLGSNPNNWEDDYRVPDVTVFLNDSPVICHGAFWSGPPDFIVEIISPYDKTREKFDFYQRLKTRELLIVDRDPWQLELYRLQDGTLRICDRALPGDTVVVKSTVLPVSFRLVPGQPRPTIEVVTGDSGRCWTI